MTFTDFEAAKVYAEKMCGRSLPEFYTRMDVVEWPNWPEDGGKDFSVFSFPVAAAAVARNGRVRSVYHTER